MKDRRRGHVEPMILDVLDVLDANSIDISKFPARGAVTLGMLVCCR